MKKFVSLVLAAALSASVLGCADKKSAPPPAVKVDTPPADAPKAEPTPTPQGGATPAPEGEKK
jgi:hypothetical protein